MKLYEAVAITLRDLGLDVCFGLVGSGNYRLVDALAKAGVRYYGVRHEANAVGMASGYQRVTGRVTACTVHQGPGFTNTLTALCDAARAGSSFVVLAACAETTAVFHNQRVDQAGFARLAGAAVEAPRPDSVAEDVARSWRRAIAERRPVVVLLPTDLQEQEVAAPGPPAVPVRQGGSAGAPPHADVEACLQLIARSTRPVVLAGRGVLRSGAGPLLQELADRIGAILATTAPAKGLFASHPYHVGLAGGLGWERALPLFRQADLVLVFGASLNFWTTRRRRLLGERCAVVHVDDEPARIGLQHPVDLALVGDVLETSRLILSRLREAGFESPGFRTEWPSGVDVREPEWPLVGSMPGTVDPRGLAQALDRLLPAERAVVVDSGHFMAFPTLYMEVPEGGFIPVWDFQAVGIGLGVAMGAAVGRPDRLTVFVVGDGGLLMNLGDLDTAVRYRIPVLVVVYDDGAYGAELHHFKGDTVSLDLARFESRDLASVARAMGWEASTVKDPCDLEDPALRRWTERAEGPFLLHCRVDPNVQAAFLKEALAPETT